jgi:hypothetical protein
MPLFMSGFCFVVQKGFAVVATGDAVSYHDHRCGALGVLSRGGGGWWRLAGGLLLGSPSTDTADLVVSSALELAGHRPLDDGDVAPSTGNLPDGNRLSRHFVLQMGSKLSVATAPGIRPVAVRLSEARSGDLHAFIMRVFVD